MIKHLEKNENPVNGLFFLCQEGLQKLTREKPPVGVAFVVGSNDLVLTCSHVFQILGLVPGMTTWLYHWVHPFRVQATILAEGWQGSDWREFEGNPKDRRWTNVSIMKPEDWREDTAFLRLQVTRIEPCPFRTSETFLEKNNGAWLDKIRVLPLGVPYIPPGQAFGMATVWKFASTNSGDDPMVEGVQIPNVESMPWSTIALTSDKIIGGFSGSPLWDSDRRLVVGLLKRGVEDLLKERVLGTDSRAFTRHPEVFLSWDIAVDKYCENLKLLCNYKQSLLGTFLPPKVQVSFNELAASESENGVAEVLRILEKSQSLIVFGEGGVGKTSLLKRICLEVLSAPDQDRYRFRWLPLWCMARELAYGNGTLAERIRAVVGKIEIDGHILPFQELRKANNLRFLILIDGLDEVDRIARFRFLHELAVASSSLTEDSHPVFICSSRPNPETTDFLQSKGFAEILVLGFDQERQRQSVDHKLGKRSDEFWYEAEQLDYFSVDMTPLQLGIAIELYSLTNKLPSRQVELPGAYFQAHLEKYLKTKYKQGQNTAPFKRYGPEFNKNGVFENILSDVAFACYSMTEKPHIESVIDAIFLSYELENRPEWLRSRELLSSFIKNEIALGSGICFIGSDSDREKGEEIEWRHRMFLEQFAAIAIVQRRTRQPQLLRSFLKQYSDPGQQQFIIDLLSAIEFAGGGTFVERYAGQLVSRGNISPPAVVLAVVVCSEGFSISREIMTRAIDRVAQLIVVGIVNTFNPCAELFSINRTPSLKKAIKRSPLKELMQDAVQKRLRSGILTSLTPENAENVIKSLINIGINVQDFQPENQSGESPNKQLLQCSPLCNSNKGQTLQISGIWISSNGEYKVASMVAQDFLEFIVNKAREAASATTNDEIVKDCLHVLIEVGNREATAQRKQE